MDLLIETDKIDRDEVAEARRMLLVHRAGSDGLCAGCMEFACRFARYPCPQAEWARGLLRTDAKGDGS